MYKSRLAPRVAIVLAAIASIMAITATQGLAAGLPVVTANSATNLLSNTATANGSINPNGAGTTYKIEYGKTQLYGQTTGVVGLGSGSTPIAVSKELTGLEQLTTYHFRVSASNSFGTTLSSDMPFEMLKTWRVGGTPTSQLGQPAEYKEPTNVFTSLTVEKVIAGKNARVYCGSSFYTSIGILNGSYSSPNFQGCTFTANGNPAPGCTSNANLELHLNGVLQVTTPTLINFGEECSYGEGMEISNGGFSASVVGGKESVNPQVNILGQFNGWKVLWSSSTYGWSLTGAFAGKAFGLS